MIDIAGYFQDLAAEYPRWNFIWLYDEKQAGRILSGLYYTIWLSVACVIFSVIIGVVGVWLLGMRNRFARALVQGYIQFFRNTPPMVQLLFFYFALDGWLEVPIISNVGWAIISLSFFAGAFNIEIFRAGLEAVPDSTVEASESLGFTRTQTFGYIVFPLSLRICLPALNNNLVNLVKTTTQAYAIAVPELLYESVSIWSDFPSAQNPTMALLFVSYIALVGILVLGMNRWERRLQIPGYGST